MREEWQEAEREELVAKRTKVFGGCRAPRLRPKAEEELEKVTMLSVPRPSQDERWDCP